METTRIGLVPAGLQPTVHTFHTQSPNLTQSARPFHNSGSRGNLFATGPYILKWNEQESNLRHRHFTPLLNHLSYRSMFKSAATRLSYLTISLAFFINLSASFKASSSLTPEAINHLIPFFLAFGMSLISIILFLQTHPTKTSLIHE